MKYLLKITLLLLPAFCQAQTVQVYVNDTTFTREPVTLTGTDSTNGKITATYPGHLNKPAYEVNYYYGYKTGLVKVYYPGTDQLMHTEVYTKGKRNGESVWYNREGQLAIKGFYVNDVKDGYWVYKNFGFMGPYKNGLKNGYWKFDLPGGGKGKLKFKKGVLQRNKKGNTVLPTNVPRSILMEGVTKI